jgi:hypothetical protein
MNHAEVLATYFMLVSFLAYSSDLKKETACSFEIPGLFITTGYTPNMRHQSFMITSFLPKSVNLPLPTPVSNQFIIRKILSFVVDLTSPLEILEVSLVIQAWTCREQGISILSLQGNKNHSIPPPHRPTSSSQT